MLCTVLLYNIERYGNQTFYRFICVSHLAWQETSEEISNARLAAGYSTNESRILYVASWLAGIIGDGLECCVQLARRISTY